MSLYEVLPRWRRAHHVGDRSQVTAPYRRRPSPSAVQRAQYADLMIYMPNDPLVKVDRMSMQHGLEVRCQLLDRRVVESLFAEHCAGARDHWYPLWAAWMLELWAPSDG